MWGTGRFPTSQEEGARGGNVVSSANASPGERSSRGHEIAQLLDSRRADARDGVEVVHRRERPVLGAVVDDLLRGDRSHPGQLVELLDGRGREADRPAGRASSARRLAGPAPSRVLRGSARGSGSRRRAERRDSPQRGRRRGPHLPRGGRRRRCAHRRAADRDRAGAPRRRRGRRARDAPAATRRARARRRRAPARSPRRPARDAGRRARAAPARRRLRRSRSSGRRRWARGHGRRAPITRGSRLRRETEKTSPAWRRPTTSRS